MLSINLDIGHIVFEDRGDVDLLFSELVLVHKFCLLGGLDCRGGIDSIRPGKR